MCANFGAFVQSVTIIPLSDQTNKAMDTIRELQDFLTHDETVKSFDNTDNKLKKSARGKKTKLTKKRAGGILRSMGDVCGRHKASVASVLGHLCSNDPAKAPSEARDIISESFCSNRKERSQKGPRGYRSRCNATVFAPISCSRLGSFILQA